MKMHTSHPLARSRRGFTMLEMILCAFVLGLLAVFTMEVLGGGRVLRSRAGHRAELALCAQSELDRLRATPLARIPEGRREVRRADLPPGVALGETVIKRADGFLELRVSAARQSPGGDFQVVLTSIHPGGRR